MKAESLILTSLQAVLLLVLSMIAGCSKSSDLASAASTSQQGMLVAGNTAFATEAYQSLRSQPGNLCFSPYGVSSALAMAYAGAKGRTESEIAKTMRCGLSQQEFHPAFRALAASIHAAQRAGVEVALANSLWYQKDQSLLSDFVGLLRADYDVRASGMDFTGASDCVRDINTWFTEKTRGRVKSNLDPRQIGPETRLLLCNAVYFRAKWATQFDKASTKPGQFFIEPEQTVTVPMMCAKAKVRTAEVDDGAILELPYAGKTFSMLVLLPSAYDGLGRVEQQFTPDKLKQWLQQLKGEREYKCDVMLPRLRMAQSVDFCKTLAAMGLASLFSPETADLSGMTGTNSLFVSGLLQQATIEVNEEGTEATAATTVHLQTRSQPLSFRANHPFMFLIMENRTGTILFLGRVADPSKAE